MIERMHGIQRREDQPAKKQKRIDEQSDHKATFEGAKGTVLGEYVTEQKKKGEEEAGPATAAVVDLTADDDDVDVVLVRDSGEQEVCLGKVEDATVSCSQLPSPKPSGFQGSAHQWPAIKVSLRRRPAQADILITATDPCGRDFGRLGANVAILLAPLMDAKVLNLRTEGRLDSRKRKVGENPGHAASVRLPLNLHLFAPRKNAKHIGRALSQKQIWLRDPTIPLGKIAYHNPQAIQVKVPRAQPGPSNSNNTYQNGYGFVARTVEEIRSDVIGMFDSLAKSEDIPEMEQPSSIKTSLLTHQKQALQFMTSKEADEDVDGKENNSLWKLKLRGNGERYFYNIITGMFNEPFLPIFAAELIISRPGISHEAPIYTWRYPCGYDGSWKDPEHSLLGGCHPR